MLKRRLDKLERDSQRKSREEFLFVFQSKKRDRMQIPGLDFFGTIADGEELLSKTQGYDRFVRFNASRPNLQRL